MTVLLVHYHEIALKARNRPFFVNQLVRNLKRATADFPVRRIQKLPGRLLLELAGENAAQEVAERVRRVFGVANCCSALRCDLDLEALKDTAAKALAGRPFQTFRVTARRAYKTFPLTSPQLNEILGTFVLERFPARVDLKNPELTLFVDILPKEAFIYLEKVPGPGGLPVGVAGRVIALLSGGIDSPVAAYRMMRRGCQVSFVHFHGAPFLDRRTQEKTREIVKLLTRYQYTSRLYLVPFGEVQQEVVVNTPAPYRVLLYRRLMARIAEHLASLEGAKALVTGESLGQVASQTLENLTVIEEAVKLPLFRPLIGMDKEEITEQAKEIGTYEISIQPDQDCCTLFVPRHPATRATMDDIGRAEMTLDLDRLVKAGAERADVEAFTSPEIA
ncbi:MAG: tRNA uracil 4-sulfurtransferase ThiI [Candidatus Methylomirabilales bacterium]|jgi:thiamine biosynthesis protein ThiI|nr:tRNA 4-thiouridine(8) synthase ThiI [candidate division NC10 bacterium]